MDGNEKKKSISGKKLFLIIYICIFGFMTLIQLISELSSGGEDLPVFWIIIIFNAFSTFIMLSPFLLMIRGVKEADEDVKFESLSKVDFVNSKDYYRDILKKYSPAELSYIDDFNIDYPKDIIVTLLSLKLKNKITIVNNYITILDFNDVGLKKTEKYILGCIKDGRVRVKHSHDIMKDAESEALEDNLIIESEFNAKKTILKMLFKGISKYLLFFLIFIFVCLNSEKIEPILNSGVVPDVLIFVIILMICFGFLLWFISISLGFIKMFTYLFLKSRSHKRTDIGEQVNKKIEGLKNYIKDFSILDEREQKELMIWDEYLIYSVLFNHNYKIINELSSLIEAEFEVGKVYFESVDNNSSNN